MTGRAFVPEGFEPPLRLETTDFVLEPLGPEHNELDHAAWTSSIEHIHATPGFDDPDDPDPWPVPMTLEQNLEDLRQHRQDFEVRRGFTYTVLDPPSQDVIGCVYIYPSREPGFQARVQSWVRASRADLDPDLWRSVSSWLAGPDWPFETWTYRPGDP